MALVFKEWFTCNVMRANILKVDVKCRGSASPVSVEQERSSSTELVGRSFVFARVVLV